jgi:biopolymer transport protein ExbD
MYRRRNRHKDEEVQLNLAAMLDMAFQLLAFFILTFQPAPVEGHLALNLPRGGSSATMASASPDDTANAAPEGSKESCLLIVTADAAGGVGTVAIEPGGNVFGGAPTPEHLAQLDKMLGEAFGGNGGYEQLEILVAPKLRYDALMTIVDVCLRQQLPDGSPLQNIRFERMRTEGDSAGGSP